MGGAKREAIGSEWSNRKGEEMLCKIGVSGVDQLPLQLCCHKGMRYHSGWIILCITSLQWSLQVCRILCRFSEVMPTAFWITKVCLLAFTLILLSTQGLFLQLSLQCAWKMLRGVLVHYVWGHVKFYFIPFASTSWIRSWRALPRYSFHQCNVVSSACHHSSHPVLA